VLLDEKEACRVFTAGYNYVVVDFSCRKAVCVVIDTKNGQSNICWVVCGFTL